MTYVVTESCIKCKYTDCVEACPVHCFYEGENMLVIDPIACIDCGVCVPECPIGAIRSDADPAAAPWIEMNRRYATLWPNITAKKPAPPDAGDYRDVAGKFATQFSPEPGAGD